MKTVTCQHCSANIKVDAATRLALRKSPRFQCPNCSGFLPTSLIKAESTQEPHGALNRNFLILGGAALLVLGGLGFLLASKQSGDTIITAQNIQNEISNNSYFTQLIADGITTRADLDAIADIQPDRGAFIGISAAKLDWKQAQDLAKRTGAVIYAANKDYELDAWVTKTFDVSADDAGWSLSGEEAAVLAGAGVDTQRNEDGRHKVLLHWIPAGTRSEAPQKSAKGLVAYYPFNGNAEDASGNGNHAEVHGAELTDDKEGNAQSAYQFDGNSSFILAPVDINPDKMPNMTMVAWARAESDQPIRKLISHDAGAFGRSVGIDSRGGGTGWSTSCGKSEVLGFEPVRVNEWDFVAVVYEEDREMVTMFVNGRKTTKQGVSPQGKEKLTLGGSPILPQSFHGVIDEVRIYDHALDESEIQGLYQTFTEQSDPDDVKQPEAFVGRKISDVADLETAVVLLNDEFDDPNTSGFSWAGKERYQNGRILFNGMESPCWGYSGLDFNDFACEVVARTSGGDHNGWGICVFKTWGGVQPKEHVHGVEILLSSIGELSVIPCRWISEHQEDIDAIGPIPVASFMKNESNTLMVTFSETRKLSVFVNGVEACPPVVLPYVLEPAGLQMASIGGVDAATRLEFESFKVFSLVNRKPGKPSWTVTGEQSLIGLVPTKTEVGFWQLLAGEHPENRLVAIKGKPSTDYLLAHAPSRVEYDIPTGAAMFKALGLSTSNQNCTFSVAVDGKAMFTSETLEGYEDGVVDINVMLPKDAKTLAIITTNVGDFNGCQTCWVEPRFVKGEQDNNGGGAIPDVATPATSEPEQSAPDAKVDIWIDTQGSEIQARFIRLVGETLIIDFKEKETRIPLSRLSAASRALAMKRQAEANP